MINIVLSILQWGRHSSENVIRVSSKDKVKFATRIFLQSISERSAIIINVICCFKGGVLRGLVVGTVGGAAVAVCGAASCLWQVL
jgi:hypothetical protein